MVVLRYLAAEWTIQRLVRVKTLAKNMSDKEIARELIEVLPVQLSVSSPRLLVAMRDRTSVSGVAMRTLNTISTYYQIDIVSPEPY